MSRKDEVGRKQNREKHFHAYLAPAWAFLASMHEGERGGGGHEATTDERPDYFEWWALFWKLQIGEVEMRKVKKQQI